MARRDAVSACARFARTHAVLLVSAAVAAATMLAVPPDAAYLGYFDLKTLACLFGILALVGALRNAGVFEATARALVARFSTCRAAIAAIVGITLVLSMIATNDMALVMMLPLCAATLLKAGWERALPFAFIMQSLAANLGGMIVPFGNPDHIAASSAQNYGAYDLDGVTDLRKGEYMTAHGGYDQTYANADPDRVLPIDVLRDLEKEGKIGKLYHVFYSTVGNGTSVANARKFGTEIGSQLKAAHVDGVILTST